MNLEDLEHQVIRDAQRELAPAPGVRERHEVELLSRLARGVPTASDTSGLRLIGALARGPAARGLGPFWGSPARMLGVGLALGALVGGVVGYSLGQRGSIAASVGGAEGAGSQGAGALAVSGTPQGESVAEPSGPEPSGPEPSAAEPSAAEPSALAPRAGPTVASASSAGSGSGAVRSAKPPARGTRASEGNESSLAEELAMLQRARRALAAENGQLALGIVQELDERFPKGVLIEERSATRVLALCKLERVPEAREVARLFLARHPGSVYAERVRTSCVATPE